MKKRWTALLLALAMVLALTACGGDKQPAENEDAQETVEETQEDTQPQTGADDPQDDGDTTVVDIEDVEQEQEQEQEPQVGQQPADTNEKPQSQPVTKPSTEQKPAEEEKPEAPASADLAAFAAGLASSQTNWPGMMALEGEALETYYPGLSDLSPKQCVVQMAMISASAVEIALVEVADSADVDTVKGIFQSRIDYQVGDGESPGGLLYPASVELWQNNARIVSNGNYVMLVVFENADGVADSFNALFA